MFVSYSRYHRQRKKCVSEDLRNIYDVHNAARCQEIT